MSKESSVNRAALRYLYDEQPEVLERSAVDSGHLWENVSGIARLLLDPNVGVEALTPAQDRVYRAAIRPLIYRVPCEGPVGLVSGDDSVSSCAHGGYIDDQSLVTAYQLDDFVCQNCRHERDKMA
jgi:hypothetical protein